ncbi:SET domain-containing protein [Diaphorobacter aerolatus]|uniref:SET domain-containing protein-lysine N-methyltransferase n=1 Tax=Diaphorobacter aerolatus TaxID=1288495 RepID=A0A7H0GGV3_9BURK|nr:SET domain-containing protein-lysine N-methyltransferase [Diaphorobacter aerolatus]QNP47519.1 SET domain-containing protein-lysine N-methyltransferase [Diaphorobacter aerolatus]
MARNAPSNIPMIPSGRRIQTRQSGVHGKGVFALQDIAEGEVIIEYIGEVIGWQEAQDRHPHDPRQPNHTFYFHVDEDHVIDAKHGGNSARWINHSCDPNCYADEIDGRIFITALQNIPAGEELNYDYGLIIEERYTAKLKAEYPCWCGSENCRGTLLAPKRGWVPKGMEPAGKKKKSKSADKAKKSDSKKIAKPKQKKTDAHQSADKDQSKAKAKHKPKDKKPGKAGGKKK